MRGTEGSAILKMARLPAAADPARAFPTSDEPDHWNYWRREALAYQTGLAPPPTPTRESPRPPCSRRTQAPAGEWSYGWPTSAGRPAGTGLCHGWGASPMSSVPPRRAGPANLVDQDGTSVLLDWSFTGDSAVGEDIAKLIIDSCADGLMDAALLPEIAERATDGYLRGLRDGGWTGSADAVRTAIAASGAAKYSWLAPRWRAGRPVITSARPPTARTPRPPPRSAG